MTGLQTPVSRSAASCRPITFFQRKQHSGNRRVERGSERPFPENVSLSHQPFQTGYEFRRAERLHHVVVGAEVEAQQDVLFLLAGREH